MKRSVMNEAIRWSEDLLKRNRISLPMFAFWTPEEFESRRADAENIIQTCLGWDVTDFGTGDFEHHGAVLFTLRNGNVYNEAYGTPYAEKYILLKDGCEQEIPLHYHFSKTEDIINRGNGILVVELCGEDANGDPDFSKPVTVMCDGVAHTVAAGEKIEITPGNSITLTPHMYHRFYAKTGAGDLIVGEVSKINDDSIDNKFAELRYAGDVEEDEAPYRILTSEFKKRFL